MYTNIPAIEGIEAYDDVRVALVRNGRLISGPLAGIITESLINAQIAVLGTVLDRRDVAQAEGTTVLAPVKTIRTQMYSTDFPGLGGATYERVATEPTHAGKFRSSDRFLPDGTESTTNGGWWEIVPGPVLSVASLGAPNNGTDEAHTQIQDAIDVMEHFGGGTVLFPNGDYLLAKAGSGSSEGHINLKTGVTLRGQSWDARLFLSGTQTRPMIGGEDVSECGVIGLHLEGSGTVEPNTSNLDGIMLRGEGTSVAVRGNKIHNVSYDGVLFIFTTLTGIQEVWVQDNLIYDCGDDAINIAGDETPVIGATITGNSISNCTSSGIHVSDGAYDVVVSGNRISGCANGIDNLFTGDRLVVTGNIIKDCTDYGIYVHGSITQCTVVGNVLKDNGDDSGGAQIIVTQDSVGTVVSSNHCTGGEGHGIWCAGNAVDPIVIGNTVRGAGTYGIRVSNDVQRATIKGNSVHTTGSYGIFAGHTTASSRMHEIRCNRVIDAASYGVIMSEAEDCLVCENFIDGTGGTRSIIFTGTHTGCIAKRNWVDLAIEGASATIADNDGPGA